MERDFHKSINQLDVKIDPSLGDGTYFVMIDYRKLAEQIGRKNAEGEAIGFLKQMQTALSRSSEYELEINTDKERNGDVALVIDRKGGDNDTKVKRDVEQAYNYAVSQIDMAKSDRKMAKAQQTRAKLAQVMPDFQGTTLDNETTPKLLDALVAALHPQKYLE